MVVDPVSTILIGAFCTLFILDDIHKAIKERKEQEDEEINSK